MTKPSVIRVGQQFQAEVPAWHGPVPLDGSAPMMPEIDLTEDVLALPRGGCRLRRARSEQEGGRGREKEEAERLRQASEERARRERARRATDRAAGGPSERAERLAVSGLAAGGVFVRTRGYDASAGCPRRERRAGLSASAGSVGTPLALALDVGGQEEGVGRGGRRMRRPDQRPRTQDNEAGYSTASGPSWPRDPSR